MSAESDKDGSITITLSFAQGTNPDIAQVQVQNKLQLALPRLPQAVQQQGVQVAKSAKNFLLAVAFVSTDHSMGAADIADFVASHLQDPVSRALESETSSSSARSTPCAFGSTRPSSTTTA